MGLGIRANGVADEGQSQLVSGCFIGAHGLALLPAQQSGASLIHARMRAALADLDQGEFTEGGVACTSNLVPKSATSDGDKAKGPALPVAVFGEMPWQ